MLAARSTAAFEVWLKLAASDSGLYGLLVLGALVGWLLSRRPPLPSLLRPILLLLAIVGGLVSVINQASLFDDAYISFRYSRNFADGLGLVWNAGERVEGYTNPLWTVLLGVLYRITGIEAPQWALLLGPVIFVATLLSVDRVSRLLSPQSLGLPIAAGLLAVHPIFTAYGTTGMETGLGALLAVLGTWALISARTARGSALTGLAFILATFTRPDHALLYLAGSAVIALELLAALRRRDGVREAFVSCLAYAAPFLLYTVYLGAKVAYYGEILPNTYHAKSADMTWYSQGWIYASAFLFGEGSWLLLITTLGAALWPGARWPVNRFARFVLILLPLHLFYVARVGGDFMNGRFFVVVLPLLAIGGALALDRATQLPGRKALVALLVGAALLGSTRSIDLFDKGMRWGIIQEHRVYPVKSWFPPVVKHHHDKMGRRFARLHEAGVPVVLGTGGVGMVGYHSQLELIDMRGLTDRTVARQKLKKRTRPGHEKVAPQHYIRARKVDFLRLKAGQRRYHPKAFATLTQLDFGDKKLRDPWALARYDRELLAKVKEADPDLSWPDFENYLDRYIRDYRRGKKTPPELRRDLPFFQSYYFDHNDDPKRRAALACAFDFKAGKKETAPCAPPPPPHIIELGDGPIVLGAIGDLNLAEDAGKHLAEHGSRWVFEKLHGTLDGVDLTLGNLETAVATEPSSCPLPKSSTHRMEPSYLDALPAEGIALVSLANNHAMDQGGEKLEEMLGHLDEKGIAHVGAGKDRDGARRAVVINGGGAKIGVIGWYWPTSSYTEIGFYAREDAPGVNRLSAACAKADVDALRAQGVNIVIGAVHWGGNYVQEGKRQKRYAEVLVEAGVDVVLGHGSHVAQGVEVIDGVAVIYSLGNHVFGSWGLYHKKSPELRTSMIAKLAISGGQLRSIDVQGIRTDNREVQFQPRLSTAEEGRELEPLLARYGLVWESIGPGQYRLPASEWK